MREELIEGGRVGLVGMGEERFEERPEGRETEAELEVERKRVEARREWPRGLEVHFEGDRRAVSEEGIVVRCFGFRKGRWSFVRGRGWWSGSGRMKVISFLRGSGSRSSNQPIMMIQCGHRGGERRSIRLRTIEA